MSTEPADTETDAPAPGVLRLAPHITDAEALAVFRRKVPGAVAEAKPVVHPFWWTALRVRTRGLFGRHHSAAGQVMNIVVNADSGRGMIADFEPCGVPAESGQWEAGTDLADVRRTARSLARTKVLKTVKLGMGIEIDELFPPRPVLKPNWLVTGANARHSATILVDGLDSSHYIVRVAKLQNRLSPSSWRR